MLIIRRPQVDILKEVPQQLFRERMLPHLKRYFAGDCKRLGDEQIRVVIDNGVVGARSHGFETRGEVCRYVNLMFMLGSGFDDDPQLPWVSHILQQDLSDPGVKMQALYSQAIEYLKKVRGVHGHYFIRALLKARRLVFETLAEACHDTIQENVLALLSDVYRQKYKVITPGILDDLFQYGREAARRFGLTTCEGVTVYLLLMFVLGGHFGRDPVFPWAAPVLADFSLPDPVEKARVVFQTAKQQIELALQDQNSNQEV